MTDETTRLRDALLADIHVTYCERSAVAMRNHTPQVTAHQVEGMVADRLTALIEQARQDGAAEARAGLVSVEALAKVLHDLNMKDDGCIHESGTGWVQCRRAAADIIDRLAALAATPPAPAVERVAGGYQPGLCAFRFEDGEVCGVPHDRSIHPALGDEPRGAWMHHFTPTPEKAP